MSQNKVVTVDTLVVGRWVRRKNRVDRYHEFSVPAGATWTIDEVTDWLISITVDLAIEGVSGAGAADKAAILRVQVPPCQLPASGTS